MKNNLSTSAKFNPTAFEKLTQEEKEKLVSEYMNLTPEEWEKLAREEIANLTPEEREIRIRRAKEALYKVLRDRARALIDANPGSFNKIH